MTPKLTRGTPVISLAEGTTLGVVDRVYFDPERLAVVGFTIRQHGGLLGGGPTGVIDIADVRAFGPDAVTIDDVGAVRSELAVAAVAASLIEMEALLGRAIVTAGGRRLGRIAEVIFDEDSHQLLTFVVEMDDGGQRRIAAADVATVGEDLVVVAEPASRVVTLRPSRTRSASSDEAGVSRAG